MVAAIAAACAGTSGGGASPGGSGGAGGASSGGTGGASSGGTGGASSGGTGGSAVDSGLDGTGGLGGSSGWSWGGGSAGGAGGVPYTCDAGGFWPCTYSPACAAVKPAPADHDAYRTTDCRSCHGPGHPDASIPDAGATDSGTDAAATGALPRFLFSGFVWDPYTPKGEPKIEVGVGDGNVFYYACTDDRGFFFVPASAGPEPDWTAVQSRLRSAIGEKIMPTQKRHGTGCNSSPYCHGDPQHHLFAPL